MFISRSSLFLCLVCFPFSPTLYNLPLLKGLLLIDPGLPGSITSPFVEELREKRDAFERALFEMLVGVDGIFMTSVFFTCS